MNRYDSYKPTGIEWIGEIPAHWEVKKLKYISYMKGRIGWQNLRASEFSFDEDKPYLITGMNFKDGVIRWDEVYHIAQERYDEAPEIQLQNGDVLLTKDGSIGKLLFVDQLPGPASLNSHLLLLRPKVDEYVPKFIYHLLNSKIFKDYIEIAKTGTTFFGISQEATGMFPSIYPPKEEQITIANYLDQKTVQIDKLIANKQQLIELLKQERTAIINEAVSGEGKNWEKKKLKFLTKVISKGTTPSTVGAEIVEEGEVKFLKAENILQSNSISQSPSNYISLETDKILSRSKLECNDVLIVIAGATIGKVGILTDAFLPANTNQAVCFIRLLNKELDNWIWLCLQSYSIKVIRHLA